MISLTALLWMACNAQVQPSPVDEPTVAPPPSPANRPAPSAAAQRVRDAVARPAAPAMPPLTQPAPPPAPSGASFFERSVASGPLHYAFYYAADYAAVTTLGALTAGLLVFPPPTAPHAMFGPSYDPATRDTSDVMSHRYDLTVGRPYVKDTVPFWAPPLLGNGALLATSVLTLATGGGFRKWHHFILGALEAQLATQVVGELMKSGAGRLRPDYRDRMARYYCAPGQDVPSGVDCTGVRAEAAALASQGKSQKGVWISASEFNDGRRAFPSGHTFSAFSIASYLVLFLGGELVWGDGATAATRIPGVAAQAAALTAASFVAASRLTDGRHSIEDVVVGAGLGSGMAAACYFLHFDLRGRPYVRSLSFTPFSTPGGMGLGFKGSWG